MLRPRPHRPALTPEEAKEELRAGRWTQFDGDVVDAFLALEAPDRIPAVTL
jgi:HD-GYP domain-containing protein (c-di-GMP phosphodiesterase class II)